jgi:hypothetical protein
LGWLAPLCVGRAGSDQFAVCPDAVQPASGGSPIALGPGPHLFLDDTLINQSSNLTRRINMPVRDPALPDPIVTGRVDGCFQPYLTVIHETASNRFRLWYGVPGEDLNPNRSHLGYLESADGIHWIRPHRVLPDPGPIQFGVSVLAEGAACGNPAHRFKLAWWYDGGLRIATSPDGLVWKPISPAPLLLHNHDITGLHWDSLRRRYVATVSFYVTGPTWSGTRRVTKHSTSEDLVHWTEPWLVLAPDDRHDEGETQFYAMDGYLARGDLIIGMVKVLRDDLKADQPPQPPGAYGIGYTALAWTRDGKHWTRDRARFFERDPQPGAWDHAHAWIDEQVLVGDEVFLYYGGYRSGHKVNRFSERQIGLVRMKRDRYVARAARAERASFRTPLVILDAEAMTLNLEAPEGEVVVQVLDRQGQPIPGFTRRECRRIAGDALAQPVRWRHSLRALRGTPVRLEFFLRNARLYAFDLHGAQGAPSPPGAPGAPGAPGIRR